MNAQIRYPSITAADPRQQLEEIRSYLYQLAEQLQFLLEANFISIFGGIIGVAVGYLLMPVVRLTGMSVVASTSASVIALLFAVVTGTLFGFYPAWQAACMKPIEALNHE